MSDEVIAKLSTDLRSVASTLSDHEARFLVDSYYSMQDNRMRAGGQIRALTKSSEPHAVLDWLSKNSDSLENQIKAALDYYARGKHMGQWAMSVVGIGPVIAAGLMAHIDITKSPTVGHIWRFAGLDPTSKWLGTANATTIVDRVMGKEKKVTTEHIAKCALLINSKFDNLNSCIHNLMDKLGRKLSRDILIKAVAKRPWNASLKVLCWKIGESFVKVSNHPEAFYGHIYQQRKALESQRNEDGMYADQAAERAKQVGKSTEAYKYYSVGKLSPGHIHARAKRYAVKLFLSHWHNEAYRHHYNAEPPLPYPIAILGHAHMITAKAPESTVMAE